MINNKSVKSISDYNIYIKLYKKVLYEKERLNGLKGVDSYIKKKLKILAELFLD